MNLAPLFKAQKELDDRIVKEKGLEGQYLLDKKILALQVELGELANEWRGFKFWSEDQEPKTEYVCELCEGRKEISALTDTGSVGETYEVYDVYEVDVACPLCEGYDNDENPMLIEYVDCLHFILSIGNKIGDHEYAMNRGREYPTELVDVFNSLFEIAAEIRHSIKHRYLYPHGLSVVINNYEVMLGVFTQLGEMLGFTWEQIEQAYYDKNKINHDRQASGY